MTEMHAVTRGVLLGGALGAALAYLATTTGGGSGGSGEEETTAPPFVFDEKYKHLARDAALCGALQEPAALFASLDDELCHSMLQGFEELAALYALCRKGVAKPSLLAEALRARRAASSALATLTRLARRRNPAAASDISEDLLAAQRYLSDAVYNIDQEQGLQRVAAG
jgi:hypothetical protein